MPAPPPALNLPIIPLFAECRNILIAGMGGGYDVYCGLPIYLTLQQLGLSVHLANFSFAEIAYVKPGARLTENLVGVQASDRSILPYFPELYLSRWLHERKNQDVTVWCFGRSGALPLIESYRTLVEHLGIDAIILIDGGVDSLLRGNEPQIGTPTEDALSLLAVYRQEQAATRLVCCLGLGAETDISHAHVFESIAALAAHGGYLGSCSLTSAMEVYRDYEDAVTYVHERSPADPSVINASVVSAAQGRYGNFHLTEKTRGSRLWISPLMPMYWFFQLESVAARSLLFDYIAETETLNEAMRAVLAARNAMKIRPNMTIPLT